MDATAVAQAMREVADAEIRPRFRALAQGDIHLKAPGDYVTEADLSAERALIPRLQAIRDIPVVGEEATAADPTLPRALANAPAAWVVDPVDGTSNFVAGSPTYAVMVALVEDGEAVSGWILHPETGDLFEGHRGHGATLNGVKLTPRTPPATSISQLRGHFALKYAPASMAQGLAAAQEALASAGPTRMCAGFDYADLATGTVDTLMFFRTLAWDHAPGAAIVRECGFTVRRVDGNEYSPAVDGAPLLITPAHVWEDTAAMVNAAMETAGAR